MYIGLVIGSSRKWGMPACQQLACMEKTCFPASTSSLRSRTLSRAQGCRMGLLRSATDSAGCLPVARNSSLETPRCAGSGRTGPAPLAGGMNTRVYANHPALGLGVKLGGDTPCAIAELIKLPARQSAPARTLPVTFPACLDIGILPSTRSARIERRIIAISAPGIERGEE